MVAHLRLALEVTQTAVWDWHVPTDALSFTPAYARMLGYEQGELEPHVRTWERLVHPDDKANLKNEAASAGQGMFSAEFRMRCRDGSWRWIHSRGVAIERTPGGAALRIVGTHVDITERVELARQLEAARVVAQRASDLKDQFLANMSHELRTPLTVILGFADLIADPTTPEPETREHAATIRGSGEHLLKLISDILDLSKIEANRVELERTPCDPAHIIRDAAEALRPRAEGAGLVLSAHVEAPAGLRIFADGLRLRQIIDNLLSNAIKFTPAGSVTVRLAWEPHAALAGGTLRLQVADTGIGIAAESAATLFERFQQADASTSRRFGGTGLGLAITRRLVELMGGQVVMCSTPQPDPAHGSTFTVTLPVTLAVPAGAPAPPSERGALAEPDRPLQGLCILVAEDSPASQRLIKLLLTGAGARATVVGDGQSARDLALRESFDLVIMDMQLPTLDGYGAVQQIRAAGGRVPIIALTAHAMVGDRARCLEIGCDVYMTKPVRRDPLIRQCVETLARSRAALKRRAA
ncbi:hypothetical protein BH11PLA1_BH11PLA1_12660 [soil metagenome]